MITFDTNEDGSIKSSIEICPEAEAYLEMFYDHMPYAAKDLTSKADVIKAMQKAFRMGWAQCGARANEEDKKAIALLQVSCAQYRTEALEWENKFYAARTAAGQSEGTLMGETQHGDRVYISKDLLIDALKNMTPEQKAAFVSTAPQALPGASVVTTVGNEASHREAIVWADDATPFNGAQVKKLLEENETLRKNVERRAEGWDDEDKALPEDPQIKAVFPTRSGRDDLYGEAMRLVGAKRSKYGLIDLVNWLLHRIEGAKAPTTRTGSCSICKDYDCPGADRFKGFCPKKDACDHGFKHWGQCPTCNAAGFATTPIAESPDEYKARIAKKR